MEIINFEKKNITRWLRNTQNHKKSKKSVTFTKKRFIQKYASDKNHCKVRDHCHYKGKYRGAPENICSLKYNVNNKIHVVFHNRSNLDYHFIVKEWTNEFKAKLNCLRKNTEKYIKFSVPTEKESKRIGKHSEENVKIYLTSYNWLTAEAHYQILSTISLKEIIKGHVDIYGHENITWKHVKLPEKEDFYSDLNMKHIIDGGYKHAKRVCKDFEIKNLRKYHDF